MVNYPTSLDDGTLWDVEDHITDVLAKHHNDPNDAIIALETKVGIDNSAVVTTHEYKVNQLHPTHDIITFHSASGLTAGHVIRAATSTTFAFAALAHGDLSDAPTDAHHDRDHAVSSTGPHEESGLTVGHVLRASTAAAFSFAQLQHSDLGGVTSDLHHAEGHQLAVSGGPHTDELPLTDLVAGASGDIIFRGATDWQVRTKGADGKVLKLVSGYPDWVTEGGGEAHDLDSVTHTDVDTITGAKGIMLWQDDATDTWARLNPAGTVGHVLKCTNADGTIAWGAMPSTFTNIKVTGEIRGTDEQHRIKMDPVADTIEIYPGDEAGDNYLRVLSSDASNLFPKLLPNSNIEGKIGQAGMMWYGVWAYHLTAGLGTTITEFSTDTTLAGNSDDAVPTEKAVKTYADKAIGGGGNVFYTWVYLDPMLGSNIHDIGAIDALYGGIWQQIAAKAANNEYWYSGGYVEIPIGWKGEIKYIIAVVNNGTDFRFDEFKSYITTVNTSTGALTSTTIFEDTTDAFGTSAGTVYKYFVASTAKEFFCHNDSAAATFCSYCHRFRIHKGGSASGTTALYSHAISIKWTKL